MTTDNMSESAVNWRKFNEGTIHESLGRVKGLEKRPQKHVQWIHDKFMPSNLSSVTSQ